MVFASVASIALTISFDLITLSFSMLRISSDLLFSLSQDSLMGFKSNLAIIILASFISKGISGSILFLSKTIPLTILSSILVLLITIIALSKLYEPLYIAFFPTVLSAAITSEESFSPSSFDDRDVLITCSNSISFRVILLASF